MLGIDARRCLSDGVGDIDVREGVNSAPECSDPPAEESCSPVDRGVWPEGCSRESQREGLSREGTERRRASRLLEGGHSPVDVAFRRRPRGRGDDVGEGK